MSEERLRTALHELGDVPPTAGLASAALTRARRDRRRTVVALAIVAAVVTAVAVTVPAVLLHRRTAEPAAPAPAVWVSSFEVLLGAADGSDLEGRSYVYDAASRGYRTVPGVAVRELSPDGRQALVTEVRPGLEKEIQAMVPFDRLAAGITATDRARALPPAIWRWSPDGTRLLSAALLQGSTEVSVLDVRTRLVSRISLRLDGLRVFPLALDWGPGGRGFVGWAEPARTGRPAPSQLVLFDEAGRPIRRLAVPTVGDLSWGNVRLTLSPDGRRALLTFLTQPDAKGNQVKAWVLDLGTGAADDLSVPSPRWYDGRHLLRIDESTPGPSSIVVTDVVTQVVVRRATLPMVPRLLATTSVNLTPGPAPPGAIVL